MYIYQYTERDLENVATDVKNLVVEFLFANKKYLTHEQAEDLIYNFAIIVRKRSFFRRLFDRKKDNFHLILVQQHTLGDDDKDKNSSSPKLVSIKGGKKSDTKDKT